MIKFVHGPNGPAVAFFRVSSNETAFNQIRTSDRRDSRRATGGVFSSVSPWKIGNVNDSLKVAGPLRFERVFP